MKKYLIVMLVGFTVSVATACSNPSAPSASKGAQATGTTAATGDSPAAPQADGGSTPVANSAIGVSGPRGVAPDCLAAAALPDVIEWRVTNVPSNARIDRGYGHEESAGCGATERALRTENDHLRFFRDPAEPTTVIVRFDKATYSCGHTQVDISINGVNVLGEVVNYGDDCKPTECVGAACNPPPPPPPPPLLDDCRTSVINPAVHAGVATFTILPGRNAELSLVSFKKDGVNFLPQKFFARVTGVFGAGPHTLTVPIVAPFQADLFCEVYPEGEDLTVANFDFWDARVLAYDYTPDPVTQQMMSRRALTSTTR